MVPPSEASVLAPPRPSYDVRGAVLRDGDTVIGWCWSPERGNQRLRVSLVIDGRVAATTIAAQPRPNLVRRGICDGRHGFSLPLPTPVPPFSLLELREWATGQAFGRILSDQMADLLHWRVSLDVLAEQAAILQRRLAPPAPGSRRLANAMSVVGTSLRARTAPNPGSLPSGLRLPHLASPRLTLLLPVNAASSVHAVACVQTLAPMLRHCDAELILVDAGDGCFSAAFAALPGLHYCQTTSTSDAARVNLGASRARAPVLIVLRPQHLRLSEAAAILQPPTTPAPILLGGHATLLARQAGLSRMFSAFVSPTGPAALVLRTPSALFKGLAGLDPSMEDGAGLAVLDFALRARQQGHDVQTWRDPGLAVAPNRVSPQTIRDHFAARWA